MIDIYPHYHPTTVIFIDDDLDFLKSLIENLDNESSYKCFTDVLAAIKLISHQKSIIENMNFDAVNNKNRYDIISTTIIDYQMPSINGLELAKIIPDKNISIILLTGVANQNDGIEALNDNTISGYINKNDSNLIEKINNIIALKNHIYFSKIKEKTNLPLFFYNPIFIKYFSSLIKSHSITEYYFSDDPYLFYLHSSIDDKHYNLLIRTNNDSINQHNSPSKTIIDGENSFYCYLEHKAQNHIKISHNKKTSNIYQIRPQL